MKQHTERQRGRFDSILKGGFDLFKPKSGDNLLRICPPTWRAEHGQFDKEAGLPEHYAYKVYEHRRIGSDASNYLCLRKMLGKPCCICDAEVSLREAQEIDDAKALAIQERWLAWIVERDGDDPDGTQIWDMSNRQEDDISALTIDKRRGDVLNIDDPENGYDLSMRRTGQMLKTRYGGYAFDRQPSPLHDDPRTQDDILDFIVANPIPDVLHYFENDYLDSVLYGTAAAADPQLDEREDHGGRRDERDDRRDDRDRGRRDERDDRNGRGGREYEREDRDRYADDGGRSDRDSGYVEGAADDNGNGDPGPEDTGSGTDPRYQEDAEPAGRGSGRRPIVRRDAAPERGSEREDRGGGRAPARSSGRGGGGARTYRN